MSLFRSNQSGATCSGKFITRFNNLNLITEDNKLIKLNKNNRNYCDKLNECNNNNGITLFYSPVVMTIIST